MRRRGGAGWWGKGMGGGTERSERAYVGEGGAGGGGGRERGRPRRPWRDVLGFRRRCWAFCSENGGVAVEDFRLWKGTEEEEVVCACAGRGHQIGFGRSRPTTWAHPGRETKKWLHLGWACHIRNVTLCFRKKLRCDQLCCTRNARLVTGKTEGAGATRPVAREVWGPLPPHRVATVSRLPFQVFGWRAPVTLPPI
jgi:hypothetical protein